MSIRVPSSYDLEALRRDLAKVEEEIKVFSEMLEKLRKRKEELLKIIEIVDKREKLKHQQEELRKLEAGLEVDRHAN